MDPERKFWNAQQKELQQALTQIKDFPKAIDLFLDHHARVHSAKMAGISGWSFEDEVTQGLGEEDFRQIPEHEDHSIAWILWHLARIEDITMNMLVAGDKQLFHEGDWLRKMRFTSNDTGNALNRDEIAGLSRIVVIKELLAYRLAVGRRTEQIVKKLTPEDLGRRVNPIRLKKVLAEGAVDDSTRWLVEYWGKKTIAGLLLMPPTRHCFVHLNEALRLKKQIQK